MDSNFGIDCRNNIDNCILEPLYDDFTEIYIEKFTTISNGDTFRNFFSPLLLREEITQAFQSTIFVPNKDKPTYEARKKYYERQMPEELDGVDSYEKNKKLKKRRFKEIDKKITDCLDPRKAKMVVEFNDRESASIRSFTVRKRNEIKVTTQFMSGKLLMFAKLSPKSFFYELSETVCFPSKEIADLYWKYLIEKVEVFHILTDTDSTALMFVFISDPNSDLPEEKFRYIIFEVIVTSKIYKRFDSSHEFWDIFGASAESRRKKLGYYEIENISNPCILTLTVNPKEYLEMLKNFVLNRKHKGIKKGSSGMGFENFSQRIKLLVNFDTFEKTPAEYKQVSRLTVVQGKMVKKTVAKTKFS